MGDVFAFITGNDGALLLILIAVNIWQAVDIHNLKGWMSSLDRQIRGEKS